MATDKPAASVDIQFPLECIVHGTPASAQTRRVETRERWRQQICDAMRLVLAEGHWAETGAVYVTILHFVDGPTDLDLDNIIKPILDALSRVVYIDDKQVERLRIERREPKVELTNRDIVTPTLANAAEAGGPYVYIRIDVPPKKE